MWDQDFPWEIPYIQSQDSPWEGQVHACAFYIII